MPADMAATATSLGVVRTSNLNATSRNSTTIGLMLFIIWMNETDMKRYSSFPVA